MQTQLLLNEQRCFLGLDGAASMSAGANYPNLDLGCQNTKCPVSQMFSILFTKMLKIPSLINKGKKPFSRAGGLHCACLQTTVFRCSIIFVLHVKG